MNITRSLSGVFEKEITKAVSFHYSLQLPDGYESTSDQWPLILFLHGAGERGNDLSLVKSHGPAGLIEKGLLELPAIVLAPQCSSGSWWDTDALYHLTEEITDNYRVDKNRIYGIGMSMGGYGCWCMAGSFPQLFAALIPICGGGDPDMAKHLVNLPIWAFHGAKDNVIPIEESQRMVNAVNELGGNAQLTEYPDAEHDSWTETYNNPAIYQWLLEQRKKS